MKRQSRLVALTLGLALLAAACGGDDEEATGTEATEVTEATEATEADTATEMTGTETEMTEETEATATEETEMTGTEAAGTIVDVAAGAEDFSTLVAAVQAAGLAETLSGEGPFTVFAPTNEAFEAALQELGVTQEELLADPNLSDILTYHVVEGETLAADVAGLDGQEVTTVNGAPLEVSVDGDTVMIGSATVTTTDIMASNGVIHAIDSVLLPPEA